MIRNNTNRKSKGPKEAQSAIEYLLLMAVVIVVIMTLLRPGSIVDNQARNSMNLAVRGIECMAHSVCYSTDNSFCPQPYPDCPDFLAGTGNVSLPVVYYLGWEITAGPSAPGWTACNETSFDPQCEHSVNCNHPLTPSCGIYSDGASALYWGSGYANPPSTIVCHVSTTPLACS